MRSTALVSGAIALAGVAIGAQAATVITFAGLEHGRIVNNQYASLGLTISADNFNRSFDIAAAFDTNRPSDPNDPDLLFPWDKGNLAPDTDLGNVLILAQNNTGAGDGVLDNPNDEGSRPAGEFIFDFSTPIPFFGFDIVDIEGTLSENGSISYFSGGGLELNIPFAAFTDNASPFYDPSIEFGNNSANRIPVVFSSALTGFDRVVIRLGGSGAVDTLVIPAPASGLALAGVLAWGRRRR